MRSSAVLFAILLASAAAGRASAATSDRVLEMRRYLDRLAAFGFSGQVLVAEHGKLVLDESRGLADAARGIAVTPHTRFPVASLTKPFTALAVLDLERAGRLSLADTLGRFFSDVPADKSSITIEQLLTHTSGLRREARSDTLGRDAAVGRILAAPLQQPPGRAFAYSNAGYELLAAIVERTSGESYDRFVARRVLGPAGMRESGFIDEPVPKGTPFASGYCDGRSTGLPRDPAPGWKGTGSGSAYSTAADLLRWHRALLAGHIVPDDVRERMMAPRVDADDGTRYGYGWFVAWPGTDSVLVFHGGDARGFHSDLRWYTREDQLIVVLTNQDVFDIDGGAVAKRLIVRGLRRILLGRPADAVPDVTPLAAADLASLVGIYDLGDGDRLELADVGGSLRAEASGSRAAAALLAASDTLAATQASLDARARALIHAVATGDTSALTDAGARADLEFARSFLAEEIEGDRAHDGELQRIEIIGTAPLPWDANTWRTYALLHFERSTVDLFLGRDGRTLNDCTSGAGLLHPLSLPVARRSASELVAFDLLRSHSVPLVIERAADGTVAALRIGGAAGPRAARVP